jgi:membrane protein DedA with SNARE-associated domain
MGKRDWLRNNFISLLTLLLVVAITVGIFYFSQRYPGKIDDLKGYGYLGAFLIALMGNAGVILAAPVMPILSAMGAVLYPVTGSAGPITVGLVGGIAAGIGEMIGYVVGYTGRGVVERARLYNRLVEWLKRWGVIAIFVWSLIPFFFDLVGIASGVLRFPIWKFFLACWLGRTILYVGMALAAAYGWEAISPYIS